MPLVDAKLRDLLDDGYTMLPHLLDQFTNEEIQEKNIPEIYHEHARNKTLKAAVLQCPGKQEILYFFFDAETLTFTQSVIDKAHANG